VERTRQRRSAGEQPLRRSKPGALRERLDVVLLEQPAGRSGKKRFVDGDALAKTRMEMGTADVTPETSSDAHDCNRTPRRCATASEPLVRISIWSVVFMTVSALGAVRPAAAQDLSVGYQFQRLFAAGDSLNLPAGFNVDISAPILGDLRVLGQFDWSRRTESKVILGTTLEGTSTFSTFGGGVRWTSHANHRATPFVQLAVGATREWDTGKIAGVSFSGADFSATDAMVQVGGGAAVPLNKRISAVGQLDYRRIFTKDPGTNSIRFVGSIRFIIK
jgi:hypothetical protein